MIYLLIHKGSGVGDQLFSYLAGRIRATDLGVDFSAVGKENWKADFIDIDFGQPNDFKYHTEYPAGKLVIDTPHNLYELKTSLFDPEFDFIPDGSVIDGCMAQDDKYFGHKLSSVNQWLKVERLEVPDDLCVINFRGGEFKLFPDLFLPKSYWEGGIRIMREKNPNMRFEVHTDDIETAKEFFPDFAIIHDVGLNWRSVRFAKYAILANSAFGIIPRLLRHRDLGKRTFLLSGGPMTIAPKGWARRNVGQWSLAGNYYRDFQYI